jgi:serine/threonine-protein kinase
VSSDEQGQGPPPPRNIDDLFVFDAAAIEATALTWVEGSQTLQIPLPKPYDLDNLSGAWLAPYRIHERLGQGSSAVVYRATHEALAREVAIKVFRAADPLSQARFLREAQALTRFRHLHLVELYDVGLLGEHPFLVMELLRGRTLRSQIEAQGPLEVQPATVITRQVALALAALHGAGLVHRDVKPANIVLLGEGLADRVKLVDLGLALDEERTRLTVAARFVGTPSFAAPEQASGAPVTPAADLYALGATIYTMLLGRPPFFGLGPAKMLEAHRSQIPPPLPLWGPLPTLAAELLAKRPEDRPTALDVIRRLTPAPARRSSARPAPAAAQGSLRAPRWVFVLGLSSLFAAGIGLGVLLMVPDPPPPVSAPPPPVSAPPPPVSAPPPPVSAPPPPPVSAPPVSEAPIAAPPPLSAAPSLPPNPRARAAPGSSPSPVRSAAPRPSPLPGFDRAAEERRVASLISRAGLSAASLRGDPSYIAWEQRFSAALGAAEAGALSGLVAELGAILEAPPRPVIERRIEELIAQLKARQADGLSLDRSNELSARIIDLRVANARAAPKDRAGLAALAAEIARQIAEP